MPDTLSILDSLPWFISIPLGFVAVKYVNLSNRQTKSETKITGLEATNTVLFEKIDKLTEAVTQNTKELSNLCGRFDEFTRK